MLTTATILNDPRWSAEEEAGKQSPALDLYDELCVKYGDAATAEVWSAACREFDALHADG